MPAMLRIAAVAVLLLALCVGSAGASGDNSVSIGDRKFSHTWATRESMPDKRSDMTATTVGDKIYLIGGCVMDQKYTFHPQYPGYVCGGGLATAVTSKITAYLPPSNGYQTNLSDAPHARYRHAAAAVGSKIFVFGGVDASDNIVADVDVFNTDSETWETLVPMPNPTTDLAAFSHGGKIYVVGGYTSAWVAEKRTQVFDPNATGSSAWSEGPPLTQGRGDTFATVIGDMAFIVGGFHDGNNFASPLNDIERLDVGTASAWKLRQTMDVARGDKAVAALHGVVHVIGGETKNQDGHSVPLRDVEVYDPESNKWYHGGDIPSQRFRFTAAAHGESIFIFGGQGYLEGAISTTGSHYPVLDTVEEYSESVTGGSTDVSTAAPCLIGFSFAWALPAVAAIVAMVAV